jgi:acyl-CoA thioesterase
VDFSEVLNAMRPDGDAWRVVVPEDWHQGRTIFGGMQVALAARAMRAALGRPLPLRSLQATFIGPLAAQDIRLRAEVVRTGRSATHARCDMLDGDHLGCTAVAIFGAPRSSSFALEIPRPPVDADPEALADLPSIPGITPQFVNHIQLRWAIGTHPYTGQREPRSTIFARMRDRACSAEDALIALADSIPTPALSMLKAPAPASSLNWMLEILGDPERLDRAGWCQIGTEVRAGTDGYLSQTSTLWGPDGHAYCVSHQTVAIFA